MGRWVKADLGVLSPLFLRGTGDTQEHECFPGADVYPGQKSPPDLFVQMKQHFGSNTTFLVLLHPCEQGIAALAASCADTIGRAAFIPLSLSFLGLPFPHSPPCFFFFLRKVVNINRSWNE